MARCGCGWADTPASHAASAPSKTVTCTSWEARFPWFMVPGMVRCTVGAQIVWEDPKSEEPPSGAQLQRLPGHLLPPAVLPLSSIPTAPQKAAPCPTLPIGMFTPAIMCNPPQEILERGTGCMLTLMLWAQPDPGSPLSTQCPQRTRV